MTDQIPGLSGRTSRIGAPGSRDTESAACRTNCSGTSSGYANRWMTSLAWRRPWGDRTLRGSDGIVYGSLWRAAGARRHVPHRERLAVHRRCAQHAELADGWRPRRRRTRRHRDRLVSHHQSPHWSGDRASHLSSTGPRTAPERATRPDRRVHPASSSRVGGHRDRRVAQRRVTRGPARGLRSTRVAAPDTASRVAFWPARRPVHRREQRAVYTRRASRSGRSGHVYRRRHSDVGRAASWHQRRRQGTGCQ